MVGCGKTNEIAEPPVKEFEALTEIKDDQPTIYLINKAIGNNYWDVMTSCMQSAATKQGCNLYYSGSQTEADWEVQVTLLEQAYAAGADAVIIAPDDSTKLSEPITELYSKGIPVILIDTTITTDSYDACFMTDNLYAGEQAAMEMLTQLYAMGCKEDEELSVGIQVGSGSSQTINERLAGFSKYWSDYAPSGWVIIDDVKVNNGDVALAEANANDFLENYPDLKGLFGCNNGSTVGFARAIYQNERTDICLIGFDYSEDMAKLIDDSNYHAATILQRQYAMAEMSIGAALDSINGIPIVQKFTDTGIVTVSKDTINTQEIQDIISYNSN